eukprot:TRINITY_DN5479_c0_g1_i1.p1 TRINITY_DN5479_c0_g1~~TRINITY_DN5479_c0_g1_i1.p1  ORF type:complete len:135 (+),score=29.97 TRINITY_DN5479_c0_g1_i1:41-445(+)
MKHASLSLLSHFLLLLFIIIPLTSHLGLGFTTKMAKLGGIRDSCGSENSVEIEGLGRFAVEEHNKKENSLLEFVKVVKAKEQVVAGTMYYLTTEVIDAGKKKIYEAKVWVKPWMNFKELQEFKPVGDGSETSVQ